MDMHIYIYIYIWSSDYGPRVPPPKGGRDVSSYSSFRWCKGQPVCCLRASAAVHLAGFQSTESRLLGMNLGIGNHKGFTGLIPIPSLPGFMDFSHFSGLGHFGVFRKPLLVGDFSDPLHRKSELFKRKQEVDIQPGFCLDSRLLRAPLISRFGQTSTSALVRAL